MKVKPFFDKVKYHFLRLPIIKSIVRWMFYLYQNEDNDKIHVVKRNLKRNRINDFPLCGEIETYNLKKIDFAKSFHEIALILEDYHNDGEDVCELCCPFFRA